MTDIIRLMAKPYTTRSCADHARFPVRLILLLGIAFLSFEGCVERSVNTLSEFERDFEAERTARERSYFTLEDFEDWQEWTVDSAENHAELRPEIVNYTSGSAALGVKYWKSGRYKAQIRKEVEYNFNPVTHLKIDICSGASDPGASFGFAFRTAHGDRFFETVPVKLETGWNRGIVIPLNKRMFKETCGPDTYRLWKEARGTVKRVMIQFFEGDLPVSAAVVDNLRVNLPKERIVRGFRPTIRAVEQNRDWLEQYEKFEMTVRGSAAYTDPFDTTDVSVWMHLVSPGGDHLWIPGFLYDFEEVGKEKNPVWKVRYAPVETGRYRYEVFLRSRKGEAIERDMSFEVFAGDSKGFVTVSPKHPRYFEFSGGDFFYPLGQNICWAADYEYYFRKMSDYGGNFVRIWMCPWNLYLEPTKGLGRYDLDVGRELDEILDLAEVYGVYVQLVFEYHDMLKATWSQSPYNRDNGGMCAMPEDFFRHAEAKRLFKKKVEYILHRWGYSANIMAWELFNEVNLAAFGHENDVYRWHKEMSEFIEEKDIYKHLVTTSLSNPARMLKLWELPHIDFTQSHFYNPRIFDEIESNYAAISPFTKPYFVGEFGRGWRAGDDKVDGEGRLLHHTIWAQFMTDSAGNAMPWWWDTYIEPFNLYHILGSLASYGRGLDRRAEALTPVRLAVRLGENFFVKIMGLQNRTSVYLWFCNPDLVLHPTMPREGKLLTEELKVYFKGMLDGPYAVEYWDAYDGTVFDTRTVAAHNGEFSIILHETDWDYAVKVRHRNAQQPETGVLVVEDVTRDKGETEPSIEVGKIAQ